MILASMVAVVVLVLVFVLTVEVVLFRVLSMVKVRPMKKYCVHLH